MVLDAPTEVRGDGVVVRFRLILLRAVNESVVVVLADTAKSLDVRHGALLSFCEKFVSPPLYLDCMRRSLLASVATEGWLPQFGGITFPAGNTIAMNSGIQVGNRFHAEAHHKRVLGADFTYSATLVADWAHPELSVDLQFRISDEGRYGVRFKADTIIGTVTLYRFMLEDRPCDNNPTAVAHCGLWPTGDTASDDPVEHPLAVGIFDRNSKTLPVTIVAEGPRLEVTFGHPGHTATIVGQDGALGVGRFGVYALSSAPDFDVKFVDIAATTDPTATSNFAVLYSTPGYDAAGTKRALVRTLNDLATVDFLENDSTFTIRNSAGDVIIDRRPFVAAGGPGTTLRRVFGMQFLLADFSDLREDGSYTLDAQIATSSGVRVLHSGPFEIRDRLVTETMLWPLSIRNAAARRAADEDFRRNWVAESGRECWSVGLDGAFVADRADDGAGATLRRFRRINSELIESVVDFRFVARITIVSGCDAQMQFRITKNHRWGVTLQAGSAGGCPHGSGPGAIRLHHEGSSVPGGFEAIDSKRLDATPLVAFVAGHAYDVEVRCTGELIEVLLDGVRMIDQIDPDPQPGDFALKAWSSTARFGHAKVWGRSVGLSHPTPGVWIPYDRATRKSSQGFEITFPDDENDGTAAVEQDLRFPVAAQQQGFHDCNNYIGEATSHGVFLSALMQLWESRAASADQPEQDQLRDAIVTAVLYLNELAEQGSRTGGFTHQESGRGAMKELKDVNVDGQILSTQFAMYGLSSFADKGAAVDINLADKAFELCEKAWGWLDVNHGRDTVLDSIVAIRLGRAAQRGGLPSAPDWFKRAQDNSGAVLQTFGVTAALKNTFRPTLRSIPWFEGVYETFKQGAMQPDDAQLKLIGVIADQLVALTTDANNGFCVIPQADDQRNPQDPAIATGNWDNMAGMPLVFKPIPDPPVGDWYLCEHFATAAYDSAAIGRLLRDRIPERSADQSSLERLATGNLHWALGLNPGVPATKIASAISPAEAPWSAASFVYNGPGPSVRTIEGFRTRTSSAKGWLATWEESTASRHRETWWIDPGNNGFQSLVNGHVLREGQWHYWNIGRAGWVSGETFMLIDGSFLKAATALEDWHAGVSPTPNPYELTKPRFFDTTHVDRASTNWCFDDPNRTAFAQASRMTTDFAGGKGFGAGRPTGHHIGELVGVLCLPRDGIGFFDIPHAEIADTAFPFDDINNTPWAQVGRAAMEIAGRRGFAAGFFTGHQIPGQCGWIGIALDLVSVFDVDDATVAASRWAFADVNAVPWAQAARCATDICLTVLPPRFAGGFFSGHQLPNKRQIVALRQL
jgi:hypothetical protein